MMAIACHNIAAFLFTNAEGGHHTRTQDAHLVLRSSGTENTAPQRRPTDFVHPDYDTLEQYP
jgi:hypothetical protein